MSAKTFAGFTLISFCILFLCKDIHAQSIIKNVEAKRTDIAPKIDGVLDEFQWNDAIPASDFMQYDPYNGAPPSQPTEVRLLFDDRAIYVGAMLYDSAPDSIFRELGERDDHNLNADFFTIDILPYNDGLNAYEFRVYASGVEGDMKYAANYHDRNWNPIWKSAVQINDSGWVVEMEIPYAAIRFPKTEEQTWGLNFWRNIRRHRESSTWNYVDNSLDGVLNQSGTLSGISDIKPPLRLFFIPYLAGYTEKVPESETWAYSYNYGLDMKLGLSESFTLDMTLIPDFGQVQSDDRIVNLSPFETYYQERRPFFTEGTELFDRGEIFYTRRIGGTPEGYWDVEEDTNYTVKENPEEIQLLNATKISGRNRNGTAIGVMNAVTRNMYAEVTDTLGQDQRILTEPATNYNMIVVDQSLKNNSYVSLYNTNVYSGRDNYIANVSGSEFELRTKNDMYGAGGRLNVSQKYFQHDSPDFGTAYGLWLAKVSGNFRVSFWHETQTDTYDINDMGFNRRNNRFDTDLSIEYNIYDPVGKILNMHNEIEFEYNMLYAPREFTSFEISSSNRTTFINYFTAGFNWTLLPFESNDFYEPRVDGWVYKVPAHGYFGFWLSPDYRKRFVVDFRLGGWASDKYDQSGLNTSLKPRFRVNDRFSITLELQYDKDFNTIGYITDSLDNSNNEVIIMGKRDIRTVENILDAKYIFNKNIGLTLRARHYWITVDYNDYYKLREDGYLDESSYNEDHDFIYNAFNIDMVFRWTFAPASELIFVWKNNIYNEHSEIIENYFKDLRHTFKAPMANSFSLKVLYYLDYQSLKRKKSRQ